MKLFTKVMAGVLLGIGLPITLLAVNSLANPNLPPSSKMEATAALVFFGLTPATVGGWLAYSLHQQRQQESRDRLRSTFFRLLQESNGHLTQLWFAMETGLDGEAAKLYLQERAKEFDAAFNVSEQGTISYFFDLGSAYPGLSAATETYDLLLEYVPFNRKSRAGDLIQDLTGWQTHQINQTLRKLPRGPVVLKQGVSKVIAEETRHQFEAIGARLLIVLK